MLYLSNVQPEIMVSKPRQRGSLPGCGDFNSTLKLQALEEPEQLVAGLEEDTLCAGSLQFLQHAFFGFKVGLQVTVRGDRALVAQPEGDDADIYARLEQVSGRSVPFIPRAV